ncbi:MAG: hypothetical protein WC069_05690 [Candidatus Shapirobacteria bacterium]
MIKNTVVGLLIFCLMIFGSVHADAQSYPTSTSGSQTCTSDTSCPTGYSCYQPPMPPCPSGMSCAEVMPTRYCLRMVVPSQYPTPTCTSDTSCPAGYSCYQPPMPPCPSGMACAQVMPARYCLRMVTPTQYPIPTPSYVNDIPCGSDSQCPAGQKCVPLKFSCTDVNGCASPSRVCRVIVISGDADMDGNADLVDFLIWKKEYLGVLTTKVADFDDNNLIDLRDFDIWKMAYLSN